MPQKIRFTKEYQDLEGMPEVGTTEKILENLVKANNLSMVYLNLSVESDKAIG